MYVTPQECIGSTFGIIIDQAEAIFLVRFMLMVIVMTIPGMIAIEGLINQMTGKVKTKDLNVGWLMVDGDKKALGENKGAYDVWRKKEPEMSSSLSGLDKSSSSVHF